MPKFFSGLDLVFFLQAGLDLVFFLQGVELFFFCRGWGGYLQDSFISIIHSIMISLLHT